jgi:hypothetical protein
VRLYIDCAHTQGIEYGHEKILNREQILVLPKFVQASNHLVRVAFWDKSGLNPAGD